MAVLAFAALEAGMLALDTHPDVLRLALVVGLVVSGVALLVDSTPVEPATWTLPVDPEPGLGRADPRTAAYLRVLEGHLSAREPDAALRDRLRGLADQTLRARHDLTVDDPRAEDLLGPDLRRVLTDPPHRLEPDRIERCVRRIEEL